MVTHVSERDAGGDAGCAGERRAQRRPTHAVAVPDGENVTGPEDVQVFEVVAFVGQVPDEAVERGRNVSPVAGRAG